MMILNVEFSNIDSYVVYVPMLTNAVSKKDESLIKN